MRKCEIVLEFMNIYVIFYYIVRIYIIYDVV